MIFSENSSRIHQKALTSYEDEVYQAVLIFRQNAKVASFYGPSDSSTFKEFTDRSGETVATTSGMFTFIGESYLYPRLVRRSNFSAGKSHPHQQSPAVTKSRKMPQK
ncbi:hypothetical protein AAHC03_014054 [Spirometra sp. Aus1]